MKEGTDERESAPSLSGSPGAPSRHAAGAAPAAAPTASLAAAPAAPEPAAGKADDVWVPAPLQRLWDLLTQPWHPVPRPQDRRRAQMLAGLALFLVAGALSLMFIVPAAVGSAKVTPSDVLLGAAVLVLGLGVYGVARTRYYEAAAWLGVFGMLAWVSAGVVQAEGTLWASSAPLYLALAVILSTVLLPLVATVFVAAVAFGLLLVFYVMLPGFDALALSNTMMFLAIASTILVVTHLVRFFDMQQIERQSEEIKESEERYRSLFEASFEGLALHEDGRIIETNQALADMFRMPRDELVGIPLARLVPRSARPHLEDTTPRSTNETRDAEGLRQDGSRFPLEFISKPYLYRGRAVQVTGFRDISERKEIEVARQKARELELANQRLVEVDQMRTRILNVASHELNTPITPLRMQVHLLKSKGYGELNQRQLNAVNILDRNLQRLSLLVRDILDVSKIEAGRLRVQREPTEITAVVEDTIATFDSVASERGLDLVFAREDTGWALADSGRLSQVVSNLLSNALKFTKPPGRVTVRTLRRGGRLRVEVEDTGVGLEPAQIARLFQPFEQVHDTMEVTQHGSGLGLFICRGIIEAHGGEIAIESAGPGRGTISWFELPLASEREMREAGGAAPDP